MLFGDKVTRNFTSFLTFITFFYLKHAHNNYSYVDKQSLKLEKNQFSLRHSIQTNLVFVLTKSLWPQYHYTLPWDYQCGEYGDYNQGCITFHIRVWAALRLVTNLRTIDSAGVISAMSEAAKTGKDFLECAEKYALDPNVLKIKCELDLERIPY